MIATTKKKCHKKVASSVESDPMEFLRGLIDGMRCGIVAVDRRGRLAMINQVGQQVRILWEKLCEDCVLILIP